MRLFSPGRMVSDNFLVANDLMRSLKARKRVTKIYMAIKTNMCNAYDCVE